MQFGKAIGILCDAGIEFVVVGGLSATFHGSARVTCDLAICYSRAPENRRRLANALVSPFSSPSSRVSHGTSLVWDASTLLNNTILTLRSDLGEIDILAEIAGLGGFQNVKQNAISLEAFGREVWTLHLPALIRAKRAAGREKDLASLPELESLLETEP